MTPQQTPQHVKSHFFHLRFFIAIQQQTGIFLACQPRQNAHHLNAIKQPFEHRLTAIYTPPPLPIIFVASGK